MGRAPRIAVIGGGLAGLTAAWHLSTAGIEPTVFETRSRPGGRMRSLETAGAVYDLGAWTFTAGGRVARLARALGLANDLATIPTTVARPIGGHLRVANLRKPLSLLTGVFSPIEVLHAIRLLYFSRTLPGRTPDETAGAWAARSFPPGFNRAVLAPLAGLYFLQPLADVSRNALLGTLRYLTHIQLMSFKKGMGQLGARLAATLDLHYNHTIESLSREGQAVLVRGKGCSRPFNGVILATPLPETLRLIHAWLDPDHRQAAERWPHASAVLVRMLLKGRLRRPALQVLPPREMAKWICGFTVERAKSAMRTPADREALTIYARPEKCATLSQWCDRDIVAALTGELARWLRLPRHHHFECGVKRWPYAVASSDPEAGLRVAAMQAQLQRLSKRIPVWAAGDYLGPASLEGAVASAEIAARACRMHFKNKDHLLSSKH